MTVVQSDQREALPHPMVCSQGRHGFVLVTVQALLSLAQPCSLSSLVQVGPFNWYCLLERNKAQGERAQQEQLQDIVKVSNAR